MAGDELVRRISVPMLAPARGEHEFLLRPQHRELPNVLEIAGKSSFSGRERYSCELQGHWSISIEATSCCLYNDRGRGISPSNTGSNRSSKRLRVPIPWYWKEYSCSAENCTSEQLRATRHKSAAPSAHIIAEQKGCITNDRW